jgi:hypothetical protein
VAESVAGGTGRLWRFEHLGGKVHRTVLRDDLDQAVGLLYDEPRQLLYITEQAGNGTLSCIDLANGNARGTAAG